LERQGPRIVRARERSNAALEKAKLSDGLAMHRDSTPPPKTHKFEHSITLTPSKKRNVMTSGLVFITSNFIQVEGQGSNKNCEVRIICRLDEDTLTYRTKEVPGILELKTGEDDLRAGCEKIFGYVLTLHNLMKDEIVNRCAYGSPTSGSPISNKRIATRIVRS